MNKRARLIAFYLPQYYPVAANDKFWGKGFTEWTNVTKARPLYLGHQQPKLPADLGFYDLRVPEVRQQQAKLAEIHGIEGFCYWHYWFGNGERVLDRVFAEVLETGVPNFPFCLGWANESWTGRWHGLDNEVIFEQKYPGQKDFERHFYEMLPAFKDSRYMRVDGCPLFLIYKPKLIKPSAIDFTTFWNQLAEKEGLGKFYFVGVSDDWNPYESGFDAAIANAPLYTKRAKNLFFAFARKFMKLPQVYSYPKLVDHFKRRKLLEYELPVVLTNWDNTPRSAHNGLVLTECTALHYKRWLSAAIEKVSDQPTSSRIIFVKSWNEWAEGNFLEPDRQNQVSYLEVTKEVVFKNKN